MRELVHLGMCRGMRRLEMGHNLQAAELEGKHIEKVYKYLYDREHNILDRLEVTPIIPNTVTTMLDTFLHCSNIETKIDISNNVYTGISKNEISLSVE